MKKGFTLTEVLGVLVLIGILITITAVSYNTIVKNSRKDAYNRQVDTIIKVTKDWVLINNESLTKEDVNIIFLDDLIQDEYLKDEDIINPITEDVMEGCIFVTWDFSYQQYTYEYVKDNNLCVK